MTITMEKDAGGKTIHRVAGLPTERDILFSDHKNQYKKGIEKRQTSLMGKCSFLEPFLEEDEIVFLVTTGCSPITTMEHLVTGWVVFYLKQSLFVVTNKRILHVPTKRDYTYRQSIAQIRYGDCDELRLKGSALFVRYRNGKKERFMGIGRRERKKLRVLLSAIPLMGGPTRSGRRTHLCPRCTDPLEEAAPACARCGLEFLHRKEGLRYSLVFPGGGYFYTRHPWLGIGDAFVELYLIFFCGTFLAETFKGSAEGLPLLVLFALMLAMEKSISVYHAGHFIKEFIPRDRKFRGPSPV